MHDRGHLLRKPRARCLAQPEPGPLDVAGQHVQPCMGLQPLGGGLVIVCAHEGVDGPVAALEQAVQQLHPHEPRGAGQQNSAHHLGLSVVSRDQTWND